MSYPSPIQALIDAFKLLPGVGPRTAERYAFGLLHRTSQERASFAQAIEQSGTVGHCTRCHNFTDNTLCVICADSKRSVHLICVVADVQDLGAIERTGEFKGVYHILGSLLSPLEGITPEDIKIKQLLQRISPPTNPATEIILAFDQTPEGESTSIYLAKLLKEKGARVTRLARGLPTGSDLNYADEMTLSSALTNRKEV